MGKFPTHAHGKQVRQLGLLADSELTEKYKGSFITSNTIAWIHSRPHHPQSQGKVELYHRTLRSKMEYDLQKMGQEGVMVGKTTPSL